jgi:hypothetical protein
LISLSLLLLTCVVYWVFECQLFVVFPRHVTCHPEFHFHGYWNFWDNNYLHCCVFGGHKCHLLNETPHTHSICCVMKHSFFIADSLQFTALAWLESFWNEYIGKTSRNYFSIIAYLFANINIFHVHKSEEWSRNEILILLICYCNLAEVIQKLALWMWSWKCFKCLQLWLNFSICAVLLLLSLFHLYSLLFWFFVLCLVFTNFNLIFCKLPHFAGISLLFRCVTSCIARLSAHFY